MFGRVSTAPIPESFLTDSWGDGGVYLAKKFTGAYAGEANFNEFPPILSGWVGWDQSIGQRTYPEYAMPTDLPPWIADTKEIRFLIGADSLVGPFSFAEAVYLRSVVKELKPEVEPITFTCAGSGSSETVSSAKGSYTTDDYLLDQIDTSRPESLFYHNAKSYQKWDSYDESRSGVFFTGEVGTGIGCDLSVSALSGGPSGRWGMGHGYFIVMDVDNYSEYYVAIPYLAYVAHAGFSMAETKESKDSTEENPLTVSGSTYGFILCNLEIGKRKLLGRISLLSEDDITQPLSSAGETMSRTFGADTEFKRSVKYVSGSIEYTFMGKTRTLEVSGLEEESHTNNSFGFGEGRMPYATISSVAPKFPLKVRAVGFWPYENADGSPVYNETTGVKLADPVP